MEEFLKENAYTILLIIKVFLIFYGIFTTFGIILRIRRFAKEKGWKNSIGFAIYTILGCIIFFIFLFILFYITDFLLKSSAF